jgi:hypothetical protein
MKNSMIIASCLFLLACNYNSIEGNGNIKNEVRNTGQFNSVDVSGSFKVEAKAGEKQKVEIIADENIIPYIETKVESNKLIIDFKDNTAINSKNDIKVQITNPALNALDISGSVDARVSNLKNDTFSVAVSGAGNVTLKGETKKLEMETSGSSQVEAGELSSGNVRISSSGSSDVSVNARDTLDLDVAGSGKISYSGNPKITQNISGSAEVIKK